MSVRATCNCGKSFLAKDHLAGRRVKCPACGGVITIPKATAAAPVLPPSQPAREASIFDDLPPAPTTSTRPLASVPARQSSGANVALIAGIAGGGVLVVVLALILAIGLMAGGGSGDSPSASRDAVAQAGEGGNSQPPDAVAPTRTAMRPVSPPRPEPVRPSDDTADDEGDTDEDDAADDSSDSTSDEDASAEADDAPSLARSVLKWHTEESAALRGSLPPKELDYDIVYSHFSWMCQLLPHLGREDLHGRFNFDVVWSQQPNLQLAVTRIPEFLNPNDDRHRWEGYPYQGVALTHFVGMSGIEDRRNVLAAELPRDDPRAGIFGYHDVARPSQITDGLGNTIMIIGSGELIKSPWVQGGGATIRGAREPYFDEISGFGSKGLSKRGAMVMFADGQARVLSADVDPAVFRAMCTTHGGETVDVSPWSEPLDRIGGESTEEDRKVTGRVLEIIVRER